ncbi:hypothetical protein Q5P01_008573 [Channa striata]|uniref:Uncharacterized protein n=1 Tax=Channa striata TaxID=64152 RepID=A0AA88N5B4_CHASR|nr:hypothetical protein Q5P01_008573 [Channa striata]
MHIHPYLTEDDRGLHQCGLHAASINAETEQSVHLICRYSNALQQDIDRQIAMTISRCDLPFLFPSSYLAAGSTQRGVSVGSDCTEEPPVTPVSPPPTAHLSPARCLHSDAQSTDLRVVLVHPIRRICSILCVASRSNFTVVQTVTQHNSSCDRRCPQCRLTVSADARAFDVISTIYRTLINLNFDAEKVNHFAPLGIGSLLSAAQTDEWAEREIKAGMNKQSSE